jgi:CubicO group peptidase (beta-lactamase class C family)
VVDYLNARLFEPLHIVKPKWEESPQGINTGGWGLYLKTEDLAKMGQLLLQKGEWNGKQLIPAEWVAGCFRADGARGQYIIVVPDKNAVIAITSNVEDLQGELNLVWNHVLPVL